MTQIDKQKLIDHLDNRIQTYENPITVAVIDGLKAKVSRGEFDVDEERRA